MEFTKILVNVIKLANRLVSGREATTLNRLFSSGRTGIAHRLNGAEHLCPKGMQELANVMAREKKYDRILEFGKQVGHVDAIGMLAQRRLLRHHLLSRRSEDRSQVLGEESGIEILTNGLRRKTAPVLDFQTGLETFVVFFNRPALLIQGRKASGW